MNPYYQDDHITLYHADCLQRLDMLDQADVLITDPPYGSGTMAKGYGRHGFTIQNDDTTEARDTVLRVWGSKPAAVLGHRASLNRPEAGKTDSCGTNANQD